MELPKRKIIRLSNYDYSSNGAYFITVCTKHRKKLFWESAVGTATGRPPLNKAGMIVEKANVAMIYPNVSVSKNVIMPNHIHLIMILSDSTGRPMAVPTISQIINHMKGYASRQAGFSLWQPRFYDHIIRNEQDYLDIWQYIDNNPVKWTEDEFYIP